MPSRTLLALPLLLAPALLPAQLRTPISKFTPVTVAATVTIPAMAYFGDLGAVRINLGYSRVNLSPYYLDLNGPSSNSLGSSVTVGAGTPIPAGAYTVRFDFVNLPAPMQFQFTGTTSAAIGSCSLNAGPGYTTVQTCSLNLNFAGGYVLLSILPTSGSVATLKQVTVTRYQ